MRKKFSGNPQAGFGGKSEFAVRTMSFTSGKGGVGKTNIVVNLAIQLTKMGRSVFVIDADLGLANIDIMLNLVPKFTIEDVLTGSKNINDIIMEGPSGFHILPSSSGLSGMQELSGKHQMAIFKELASLKTKYDYILIDTGAGIASNVLRYNAAADEICVVTNTEPTAMTDAYALMKVMVTKYQVRSFNLIVNQANLKEARSVFNRLVAVLNQFLFVNLTLVGHVPKDMLFPKAVKSQTAISFLAPNSAAVKRIVDMAHHIDRNPGLSIDRPDPSRFWQRVSSWTRR